MGRSQKTSGKVVITHFTDPMMGLSWECEPALRRVEARFPGQVETRDVMSLLVRDVRDFMLPGELALPEAEGIARYNRRLAQIYLGEEPIAGMPINMGGFALFSPNRRSSLPLCLAYEAVRLIAPEMASRFLYRLRFATVVECAPTTKDEELLRVARTCGIDEASFLASYKGQGAVEALKSDLELKARLGIYGLPAFLVSFGEKNLLLGGVVKANDLEDAILHVSGGRLAPTDPTPTPAALGQMLKSRLLASLVEVAAAFALDSEDDALELASPLLESGEAVLLDIGKGHFIERRA